MGVIQDYLLRFKTSGVANVSKASDAVKTLSSDVAAFGNQSGAFGNSISGIVSKLGPLGATAGAVGGAFVALGLKAIDMADQLADISDATGVSAGALSNLKNSLITAGGKAEDFANLASRLNKNVGEAADGNEQLQKTFKSLGVYVTDAGGNIRNTGDILRDAIAKLSAIEDPATRAKLAVELFGKEAAKLDFTKLNAVNDPFKDEQIQQLAKYRDAIDAISIQVSNTLLEVFGRLAIKINEAQKAAEEAEKKANQQGKTYGSFSERFMATGMPGHGLGAGQVNSPGGRQMTAEEQAALNKRQEEARMAALMKPYAGSTRADTSGGGFGKAGPALTASLKNIETAKIESDRYAALAGQDAQTAAALKGANDRIAIDVKAANDVKNLQINLAADIKKMTADVRANDKLDQGQQASEIAAKTKELQGKAALETQKIKEKAAKDANDYTLKLNAKIFSDNEAERQAAREAQAAQDKQFADANKTALERSKTYELSVQALQDQILLEDELRGKTEIDVRMYRDIAEEIRRRAEAIKELANIENLSYQDRLAREEEIKKASETAIELIRGRASAETLRQQSFSTGWSEAFKKYQEDALNASNQADTYFNDFTKGIEDAFVQLAKTGKLSFQSLIDSMIADFIRFQVRSLITGVGNGSAGNFFAFLTAGMFKADGGPVGANNPYIVGEKGPELFVPATAGSIVPNSSINGQTMGSTNVTYNIQAVDAQSFRSLVARDPSFIYAVTEQGRRSQPTRRAG